MEGILQSGMGGIQQECSCAHRTGLW